MSFYCFFKISKKCLYLFQNSFAVVNSTAFEALVFIFHFCFCYVLISNEFMSTLTIVF